MIVTGVTGVTACYGGRHISECYTVDDDFLISTWASVTSCNNRNNRNKEVL